MSVADKVATGTYNFAFLTVKIILSALITVLTAPAADKTQYFVHLTFNSKLQLINGISSEFQKLLKYFNSITTVAFLKIPFPPSVTVFPNNVALHSTDLK